MFITARRNRRHQHLGGYRLIKFTTDPNKVHPSNPDLPDLKYTATPSKSQASDLVTEFDDYGTELHKDARVWKVYVNETDKHDTELVKGWNDSTDVILIFAALFSAISTAFLIESSKLLQPDPAETSAQTLLAIFQTLSTIANSTQPPESNSSSINNSTIFLPSRVAVVVNTLWYLSLSLSLATALIAILAKDWCHSFITGRTGHPLSQTQRRQQKWDMLEKWRMSELLTVLPSLIHAALLLFSIGLCIYLWDKHILVAIPVICVSGASLGFYAFSSVADIVFDFFPYPTIISRLCRTEIVQSIYQYVARFLAPIALGISLVISFIRKLVIPGLCLAVMFLANSVVFAILFVIWIPAVLADTIRKIEDPLAWWRTYLITTPLPFHLLGLMLYVTLRYLVWYPAEKICYCLGKVIKPLVSLSDSIERRFPTPEWPSKWVRTRSSTDMLSRDIGMGRDIVTSRALCWLIKNCEVPRSVDIALQSIAGASKDSFREPLWESNAAMEISKRLASIDLYKDSNAEMVVSLYSRALSFLGSPLNQSSNPEQYDERGNLEVMIWDMQTRIESNVAALITDARFKPNPHNLAALRIGNTAASRSLLLMKDNSKSANELFDPILRLLERHLYTQESLHPSALLSLISATSLLSLFATYPPTTSLLPSLCVKLVQHQEFSRTPKLQVTLIICMLLQNRSAIHEALTPGDAIQRYREEVVQTLIDLESQTEENRDKMARFGIEELLEAPENYLLGDHTTNIKAISNRKPAISVNYTAKMLRRGDTGNTIQVYLESLRSTYRLVQFGAPHIKTYAFVLACICQYPSVRPQCWQLLSKFRFPTISYDLIVCLTTYGTVDLLVQNTMTKVNNEAMWFFSCGQLWLMFTLCHNQSVDIDRRKQLGTLLEGYKPAQIYKEGRRDHLGDLMEQSWGNSSSRQAFVKSLGVYAYRLMECVLQSRSIPVPPQIQDSLRGVPRAFRGLSSFANWQLGSSGESVDPRGEAPVAKPPGNEDNMFLSSHESHAAEGQASYNKMNPMARSSGQNSSVDVLSNHLTVRSTDESVPGSENSATEGPIRAILTDSSRRYSGRGSTMVFNNDERKGSTDEHYEGVNNDATGPNSLCPAPGEGQTPANREHREPVEVPAHKDKDSGARSIPQVAVGGSHIVIEMPVPYSGDRDVVNG